MPTQDTVSHASGTSVTSSIQDISGASHHVASVAPMDALALPRDAANLAGPLVLREGTVLHQRAIRADDAPRLQAFHRRLSRQTTLFRFFGVMPQLRGELAARLSHVDYENRMAVVATGAMDATVDATLDDPIIAVARYQLTAPETAEVALAVDDRWQGRGIGPQLLRTLATYARGRGFTTLIAEVMYDNDRMLAMLRHSGIPTTLRLRNGCVEERLDISATPASPAYLATTRRVPGRERSAAADAAHAVCSSHSTHTRGRRRMMANEAQAAALKRVYESPEASDGTRVLVERLWPRGLSKERAQVDVWLKEIAPSHELRKWYGHDPARFAEFRRRYEAELAAEPARSALTQLRELAAREHVTLVFAAHDAELSNAAVLRDLVRGAERP